MTIRQFRGLALTATVVLTAGFVLVSIRTVRVQQTQAQSVHLLDHQRMLVEEMRLYVTSLQLVDNPAVRATLHELAIDEFAPNLDALQNGGGVTTGDGHSVTVPPARDPATAAELAKVRLVWEAVRQPLDQLLAAAPGSPVFPAAAEHVRAQLPNLLRQVDSALRASQAAASRQMVTLQAVQLVLLTVMAALLVYVLLRTERRLLQPLARLGEATRHIAQGDLSQPIAARGLEELAQLAGNLEAMRQRLSASAQAQTALLEFSQALLLADSAQAVGERAVAAGARLLQADFGALVLPDARGRLVMLASQGWPPELTGHLELSAGTGSQTGYTIERGVPVAVEDYDAETEFGVPEVVKAQGIASGLSVPMMLEGRVVGAMLVHMRTRRILDDEAVRLLSLIANQTAVALARLRLLGAERQRADELDALRATTADILRVAELDLNHLLHLILERAVTLLSATGGDLGIISDEGTELLIVSSHNMGHNYTGTRMALGEGVMGRVVQTREPLIVSNYRNWEGRSPQYATGNWHSVMSAPLLVGDRLVGAIGVVDGNPEREFGDSHVRLLTLFAQQAALAIEQARLFAAERQRVREAETLRRAGAVVTKALQQNEAIDLILEQLAVVIPYDSASVQLLIDGMLEIVGGRGWADPASVVGMRFPIPGDNPNTVVIQEQRTHILNNAPAHFPNFRRPPHDHIRAWLGVPLIVHDRLIGMLAIDSMDNAHFSAEHARLAAAFADQVAIAIENARLYQSAVRAAEQRSILHSGSREISASLEPEQIYAAVHRATAQLMPSEAFIIALLTESQDEIEAVYVVDRGERLSPPRQAANEGLSGHVIKTGESLLVADTASLGHLNCVHAGHSGPVRSLLAVPLRLRETVLGMLSTQSYQPKAYTDDDLDLLELLAANAAAALSNARLFEQVQRLAITDSLTGLHNRRHFYTLAEREHERARRYQHSLGVIMLDIDHFKRVNDTFGHAAGDEVLRAVATRCRATLRNADILGRYGGEELVAMLPEIDAAGARCVAERLRQAVAASAISTHRGPAAVTISLGYAVDSAECSDLATLINQADLALYAAKAGGRNRVETLI